MESVIINDFNKVIEITKENYPDYVFRGQDKLYNNLTPSLFRSGFLKSNLDGNTVNEAVVLLTFKRYISSLKHKVDIPKNNEEWLFFAQHYGLPTRLLDWSENIFKALFFAVSENQNEDGELWVLNRKKLNQRANFDQYLTGQQKLYQYYLEDAFTLIHDKDEIIKKFNVADLKLFPIHIFPLDLSNARLNSQEGLFTIHPPNQVDSKEILRDMGLLKRFIIPSKKKKEFKDNLDFMGISYHTLFPDVEGVVRNIKYLMFN